MHEHPPLHQGLDLKRIKDDDPYLSFFFYPLNNNSFVRNKQIKKFAKLQISSVILFNEYLQKETWKDKQRMEDTSNTYMKSGADIKGRRRKGSTTPHLLLI